MYKLTDEQGSGYLADKLMANFERRRIAIEERNAQIENGTFKQSFIGRLRGKPKKKTVGLAGAISDTFFYTFWSAGGIKVIGGKFSNSE